MGFSGLLEALANREEGKQVRQEPEEAEQAAPLPNSVQVNNHSLPTLPPLIRTIWAKSVLAPVWYPLTHQFFSSSRPGK